MALTWSISQPLDEPSLVVNQPREAWRQWEMYSCVERHGGHQWVLSGEHPDDGSGISLGCSCCCANGQDLAGCDYPDFVCGDLDGTVIGCGIHDRDDEFEVPVSVEVRIESYFSPLDMIRPEHDVWIDVAPR